MEKVCIIIPAHNEEKVIGNTLKEYGAYFQNLKKNKIIDFEILVVLNGCKDNTLQIVKTEKKKIKEISYLDFKEAGKGFAIIKGFKEALKQKNEYIGFVDADFATPAFAFNDLLKKIDKDDGIIASRWLSGAKIKKQTIQRRILSRGFNFITRSLFLMPYADTQCGAKLFRRRLIEKVVNKIGLTQWAFDVNLLYLGRKYGFKIKEIPTTWSDKEDSKLNITKTPLQMLLGVIRLRLINSVFEPLLKNIKFILHFGDWLLNQK
jgi:glycosyltransferase involved in cell wall biosynthesis